METEEARGRSVAWKGGLEEACSLGPDLAVFTWKELQSCHGEGWKAGPCAQPRGWKNEEGGT